MFSLHIETSPISEIPYYSTLYWGIWHDVIKKKKKKKMINDIMKLNKTWVRTVIKSELSIDQEVTNTTI